MYIVGILMNNGLPIFPVVGREPGVLARITSNRAMKVGNRVASAHGLFLPGYLAMSCFDLVRKKQLKTK